MKKILFIDRDGTLIAEPSDYQIDNLEKFRLMPDLILSLKSLIENGFELVMITNQDGLGSLNNPQEKFDMIQSLLLNILESQGILFKNILVCPHLAEDQCDCRKPKTKLVQDYISSNEMNRSESFVIGDRKTDLQLAENMGLKGFLLSDQLSWKQITQEILYKPRKAFVERNSNETKIKVEVNLEGLNQNSISTGIGFFDHMLEQLARNSGIDMWITAIGDTHIDEHHLVEDVAITLGQALGKALAEKRGINRYGFWLPMDEASTYSTIDLSGRPSFLIEANFNRTEIGGFAVEMVPHFFQSLTNSIGMSLHIISKGQNTHHIIESIFKSVGRCLKIAVAKSKSESTENHFIPSTKGFL